MNRRENAFRVYEHKTPAFLPRNDDFYSMSFPGERSMTPVEGDDWFGVHWTVVPDIGQMVDQSNGALLSDISEWKDVVHFPDFENFDWEADAAAQITNWDRENQIGTMTFHNGHFERLHALMTFEDSLMAAYMDEDALREFYEAMTEYKLRCLDYAKKYYNPDVIIFHDDWGTSKNMFFAPDYWHDLIKPGLKRIVEKTHELGMRFELHSCGHIQPVVGALVEELHIDILQPLQYPQNDIRFIKENWGDRLVIRGGYNGQYICSLGTSEEEIRTTIQESLDVLAPGDCHIPYFPLIGDSDGKLMAIFEEEVAKYESEHREHFVL